MTIGIAAWGSSAGRAVLLGLQVAERVGQGAIGGFVSWAGVNDQEVLRASTQRDGTAGIFDHKGLAAMPAELACTRCAGLMSSGPDRPEPLSQFVTAQAGTGLVTGHRLPNSPASGGRAFNQIILAAMADGEAPDTVVTRALANEPYVDAGVIALHCDGRHATGNTQLVKARGDLGCAQRGSIDTGTLALVIHNAITPQRSLAALVAEVVWDAMQQAPVARALTIAAGVALQLADSPGLWVDEHDHVIQLDVVNPALLVGECCVGVGHRVPVRRGREGVIGWLAYEPLALCRDGRLISVDGQSKMALTVHSDPLPIELSK